MRETLWKNSRELERIVARIVRDFGFSEDQSERLLWLLDTLHLMTEVHFEDLDLYLKGGTCVQHYFLRNTQRFSKDIDIGVLCQYAPDRSVVQNKIFDYAKKLDANLTDTKGFPRGTVKLPNVAIKGNVVPVARTFDPIYAKTYTDNRLFGITAGTAFVSIDFFLEETSASYRKQRLNLIPTQYIDASLSFPVATRERLLADKIIVLSGTEEPYFAKEEEKDVLDLGMLAAQANEIDWEETQEMLKEWAIRKKINPPSRVVYASRKTVEKMRNEMDEQRLATTINALLPRPKAFASTKDWKDNCNAVIQFLDRFLVMLK